MEPASKKRKLAPKAPSPHLPLPHPLPLPRPHDTHYSSASSPYTNHDRHPHISGDSQPHHSAHQAITTTTTTTTQAHRSEFEAFARHLQDAAVLLQRHADSDRPSAAPYTDVSVLLLSWEHGSSVDAEAIASLQHTLQSDFHFHTVSWQIPAVSNPSIKLGVQMASFLEHARPNHLLIIYYAGRAYIGGDGNLYWACNTRSDTAKLRWDGVRCLFEDAQSDVLLLLDACSVPESIPESSHGVKQVIAAQSPSHPASSPSATSSTPGFFTRCLVDAFSKLRGSPFTTERLHEQLVRLSQAGRHLSPLSPSQHASPTKEPIFFSLTTSNQQTLTLAPLSSRPSASQPDTMATPTSPIQNLIDAAAINKLRFDNARVLACTTYVGDPSPGMSAFHQWLQDTSSHNSGIVLEGMFLGPPTMLLISMPMPVWDAVQHDKVCCFLGYVTSHNMLSLYSTLVGPSANSFSKALEARDGPVGSPRRPDPDVHRPRPHRGSGDASSDHLSSPSSRMYQTIAANSLALKPKEHQDSAEMQEAAEQLKALSHVRHRSDDSSSAHPHPPHERTSLVDAIPPSSSALANDLASPKRRSIARQETSCSHCSHAPFRDLSSLRKHIAAAHTRPFPCAFSFAGCSSTFGSKNEWKRHIASQHLCLQFFRCSACPQPTTSNPNSITTNNANPPSSSANTDTKPNEFNRKDLFTQHLRRMHAPFQIKRSTASSSKSAADSALHSEWDNHVKAMQKECLVTRRRPPQKAQCPKPACEALFEGTAAWDEWTEHVGRHMEKGETADLEADGLLATWALEEGIIEPTGVGGAFRLCVAGGGQAGESQSQSQSQSRSQSLGNTQESVVPWGRSFGMDYSQSQSQSQTQTQGHSQNHSQSQTQS